jgi:hypothetical protein
VGDELTVAASATQDVPIAIADQERRLRKQVLADMVGVTMAETDVLDLIGSDVHLRQQIDEAGLRRNAAGAHAKAGIPDHVIVAMLDEIATQNKSNVRYVISESAKEVKTEIGCGSSGGAAVETRKGDLRCRLRPSWRHHQSVYTGTATSKVSRRGMASLLQVQCVDKKAGNPFGSAFSSIDKLRRRSPCCRALESAKTASLPRTMNFRRLIRSPRRRVRQTFPGW